MISKIQKPWHVFRRHGSASFLCLVLGCAGASGSGPSFGSGLPKVAASPEIQSLEHAMFERLNRDRKAQGLPPLGYDEKLADIARFHSKDMRDTRFFEHDSPNSGSLEDRLNRAGYLFMVARENLSEAPNVETSQDGLLKSPPHHANIMSTDISHVGIGIVQGGVEDPTNLTVTQVFATPSRSETLEDAQKSILASINQARSNSGQGAVSVHPLLAELTARYIAELDTGDGGRSLGNVAEAISKEVSQRKDSGLTSVLVSAQLLADSTSLKVPERLTQPGKTSVGVAVRQVPGEGGRPMLQVLLVIGR